MTDRARWTEAQRAGAAGGRAAAAARRRREGTFQRRPFLRKEEAKCCLNLRDNLGRLPVGFCSPECERRPR